MEKERSHESQTVAISEKFGSPSENEEPRDSCHSVDKEAGLATCRVCQCAEPDRKGNVALGFLGISPPLCSFDNGNEQMNSNLKVALGNIENSSHCRSDYKGSELVEFISPNGDVFVCTADVELGLDENQDRLFELGCACKNDLALAHYACALKWFVNHGSTVCEICGSVAKNVRSADFKKVLGSLKEYEALRERTVNGEPNPAPTQTNFGVDPDAVAAIRRQRLSEITLWFNPHNNNSVTLSHVVSEQPSTSNTVMEEDAPVENTATKWAVEGTGILLATGLLTVTLAWLIAPHVGKVLRLAIPSLASQENCQKWVAYSSWRRLCIDNCSFLPIFCADKNQVRACTLLGNLVCVLVSCVWDMGITNARCSCNMTHSLCILFQILVNTYHLLLAIYSSIQGSQNFILHLCN